MTSPIERLRTLQAGGPSEDRAPVRKAADALRKAIEGVVATTAPAEVLEKAAAEIQAVADALAEYPHGHNYVNAEASLTGDVGDFFDNSPIAGLGNPLAAPVHMRVEGDEVIGEVIWGSAYEGPPGCCHGGHVAAAFDDVLGLAQDLAGQSGMTGTLTVRYRRPTPLHQQHRFVARLDRVEGRKIFTTGELYDPEDNLLAEAEGIFIAIDFSKLQALANERAKRSGPA